MAPSSYIGSDSVRGGSTVGGSSEWIPNTGKHTPGSDHPSNSESIRRTSEYVLNSVHKDAKSPYYTIHSMHSKSVYGSTY
jgi:hypothetical protein